MKCLKYLQYFRKNLKFANCVLRYLETVKIDHIFVNYLNACQLIRLYKRAKAKILINYNYPPYIGTNNNIHYTRYNF